MAETGDVAVVIKQAVKRVFVASRPRRLLQAFGSRPRDLVAVYFTARQSRNQSTPMSVQLSAFSDQL
jgi:hypothetical protein